ncbi:MAG TPA: histidine kinase dimerization/phospho-acceptor domain-containing protein [Chthonomonadaceae bacterium]|nr:histidine kinase dimerization/phospho-acceptor domain-containing protein [Chthonomonadaceae bacterium]
MRLSSMRARLTAAFALALTTLLALACAGLIRYARYTEERSTDSLLAMAADTVYQEYEDESGSRNTAAFVRQESDELRRSGLSVALSPGPKWSSETGTARRFATFQQPGMRAMSLALDGATMTIGVPWQRTEERLRSQAVALVAFTLFACVAGAFGAWLLVGRTLRPIGALAHKADETRADALIVELHAPSTDNEIQHLVTTLNGLLARVSEAAVAQSRFYTAASHELRTPLHTLSGHIEVGLSRDRTNAEYRAALEEAFRQTNRLSALVQNLLLLTRLNTAQTTPPSEDVDLSEACVIALAAAADVARSRGLSVDLRADSESVVKAPPIHAEILVRNLIENAVKYAIPGGAVTVELTGGEGAVVLRVRNECEPLAGVEHFTEPFFRPDGARQAATGGTGLGLAICAAVGRANGWTLALSSDAGAFCAEVVFPSIREAR